MARGRIVLWQVDAQADFMLPGGKLYVPGAEKLIPQIRQLVHTASEAGVFLVSSGDAHAENDAEFQQFPPHCLRGTPGAEIIPEGLTNDFLPIANDPSQQLDADVFEHSQVVLEKQSLDVFDNPHTGEIVERLGADTEYVIFGVVTEYCLRYAAKGLLDRGKAVLIVSDAIETLRPEDGCRTLDELGRQGARLISTEEALEKIRMSEHRRNSLPPR